MALEAICAGRALCWTAGCVICETAPELNDLLDEGSGTLEVEVCADTGELQGICLKTPLAMLFIDKKHLNSLAEEIEAAKKQLDKA